MIRNSCRNIRGIKGWWNQTVFVKSYSTVGSINSDQGITHQDVVKSYSDIPKVEGFPVIGTLGEWVYHRSKIQDLIRSRVEKYGPIYRETLGIGNLGVEQVFTANVDDWELACRSAELKGNTAVRRGTWSTKTYSEKRQKPPFISDMQGEEYKRVKAGVMSLMMPKEIAKNLPMLSDVTEDFTKLLEARMDDDGLVKDIRRLVHMWTFECGGSIVFRKRLGILDEANEDLKIVDVFDATQTFFRLFGQLEIGSPHHKSLMTSAWREYEGALDKLYDMTKEYFNKHGEYITDKSANMTDEERESVAMSVLIAASDTTAHTALWTLIELSTNQEVQENIYREVAKVYDGGQLTYKQLQLPYMRGFLKEVFRVKPILPMFNRILPEDLVLSGYHVPAGTSVIMAVEGYDQNQWYSNADMVKPERWNRQTRNDEQSVRNSFGVIPFGFGQRSCLGRRLAENEMYLFIAKMVYKYKILPVKDYDAICGLFITPKGDIDIRLEKRN